APLPRGRRQRTGEAGSAAAAWCRSRLSRLAEGGTIEAMVELLLIAPEDCVETVSDALGFELDALAVSVEDADADSGAERALFGEPGMPPPRAGWNRSVLRALFETEAQATEAATLLLSQDWAADVHVQAMSTVADQDWVRL